MSSAENSPGINMSSVFAPYFWGFFVSMFLGGITIVQAYIYFPHPTDRMSVQVLAAIMIILDLTSSGLIAESLYYYLIPHFGSLIPLKIITPELCMDCLISTLLTFISQMFFVYQIYTVKHHGALAWTIIGVVFLFTFLTFFMGIGCVATMYLFSSGVLVERSREFSILFGLAKGFGAVTDIMATIAMCTILVNAKTGMKQTDSLIKNLIQYMVNRGAVVTIIQTMLLISFFAAPNNLYWLAFHINVTKLYANTFFCRLNGRESLWEKHAQNRSTVFSNTSNVIGLRTQNKEPLDNSFSLTTWRGQEHIHTSELPTITKTTIVSDI
ncbi:hypothetical protein BDP27DRAFT_1335373 [Rhodocollybia butyracea]|uniref:DUF6534 domain-containing protein n=1 Tax=Rhodocollybia butyracea TaxID=206335 RepID=A0A9P5U141_9AGAR|nr:hypothetical protein BDP27DRAFT_1335373 [Rhodocollybia butyracea]